MTRTKPQRTDDRREIEVSLLPLVRLLARQAAADCIRKELPSSNNAVEKNDDHEQSPSR